MRVVLVITKGELGGAQTHVIELCRALRDRCEFLVLIGGSRESPLRDALASLNIRAESIESLSNDLSPRAVLASIRQVAGFARSWGADVMHVHSAVAAVVGRIAGRLAQVPVVYTVHGFAFKPQFPFMRRIIAFTGERLLASFSKHVICVSPAERELTLQLGVPASRISVIVNGIADNPLLADPSREPPTLVMVARMAFQKRHDLLLAALQALRARGIDPPRTLLAGDGPLGNPLREAAKASDLSCVDFCGDISNVATRLSQCQVFVLLSRYEGHPISVIEAMRAGLPILASDLPAMRALITDGVEGLLTSDEPAEIADALERLLGDPDLRSRMGAAARRRYETEFSASTMAEQVETIYSEAAHNTMRLPQELVQ
jgi:glycosyltransferase involved in cell wall biosynthesis